MTYYLQKNGLTQTEFARRMKVSQSMVWQIANKERIMSYAFAMNAANILNCKMEDFYVQELYVD